jgi:endonuclease/exonuclease/phosphatase family metal-dependent hydrolase
MFRYVLTLLLIPCFLHVFASNPDTIPRTDIKVDSNEIKPLKVLSWNIYLLPVYIFETQVKYKRAHGIADELQKLDYDIIVFQEAFHITARTVIAHHLHDRYPYQYGPGNNKTSVIANSGVWIISSIPLSNPHEIRYKSRRGTDAFARKGALLMDGIWQGQPFQIIVTHLQSDANHDIRQKQFRQLHDELLVPYGKEGVPQFICGDMNTCYKNCEEYDEMLNILEADNKAYLNDNTGTNSEGEVIDYILLRDNGFGGINIMRNILTITHAWSAAHSNLSDHRAVEATIFFKSKKIKTSLLKRD